MAEVVRGPLGGKAIPPSLMPHNNELARDFEWTQPLTANNSIQEAPPPERRQRKSVAFSEGTTLIDENGEATTMANGNEERESTAQSHSNGDAAIDDATADFDDLALKKKKKSKKPKDEEAIETEEAPLGDAEFDPAALKKKKKKKPKTDELGDFDAKLAELGVADESAPATETKEPAVEDTGDMDEGTGIWAHDSTQPIPYNLLLNRFFKQLNAHNPDLMSSGTKSHKIPPPQCLREGNKKTIFANIAEICKRMKRSEEHVTQFLFAELGTNGSTDGSRRLVIKGKFLQKQIENVLRRYIVEYVTCKTCKSPDTELVRGENRLYFIICNSCGSRRSVTSIKAGFTAQVGKRRRQQG